MPTFVPGLELSRRFYTEEVRPILDEAFPGLAHAAARIGSGSDIIGFDTPMSRDHDWGPSIQIFLRDEDAGLADEISAVVSQRVPPTFLGYSCRFGGSVGQPGGLIMAPPTSDPIRHRVVPTTVRAYGRRQLGRDIDEPLAVEDWLTIPSQRLLELTSGAVHHDGVGELTALRERLAYYPRDVWLYLLASAWRRIAQEEHLMPRAGYVGDELGSAIIGSRLVRDLMALRFLQERRYAPYPKWFGSAFRQLPGSDELAPILWRAQQAPTWPERMAALGAAYGYIARAHNAQSITEPLPEAVSSFHDRPFRVIQGDVFAAAIVRQIADPRVRQLAERRLIGGIDQFSDSTDLRSDVERWQILRDLYRR